MEGHGDAGAADHGRPGADYRDKTREADIAGRSGEIGEEEGDSRGADAKADGETPGSARPELGRDAEGRDGGHDDRRHVAGESAAPDVGSAESGARSAGDGRSGDGSGAAPLHGRDGGAEEEELEPRYQVGEVELYELAKHKVIRVKEFAFRGLKHTNADFLRRELAFLADAQSLHELSKSCMVLEEMLKGLGIFKSWRFVLDVAEPGTFDEEGRCPARVEMRVQESRRLGASVSTDYSVAQRGLSATVRASLRNALGHAEIFRASFEHGKDSWEALAQYSDPRFLRRYLTLDCKGYFARQSFEQSSSFRSDVSGISVGVESPVWGTVGLHVAMAQLTDPSRQASRKVVQQLGDHAKVALSYIWSRKSAPTPKGRESVGSWTAKTATEVSGLPFVGGVLQYVRQTAEGTVSLTPWGPHGVAFTGGVKAGVLLPYGSAWGKPSCITERMFLGGTRTIRGFDTGGAGPTDARRASGAQAKTSSWWPQSSRTADSVGADLAWCARLAALFPLRTTAAAADPESHPTLYAQAFMDVGSSVLWQSGQESDGAVDVRGTLQELGSSWRASAGVGLVLKMGAGNIEANICKVLRAARGDVASSYVLSLGLAVEGFE